ncbi:MAG: cupin domain-containing protein [Steroidobacteraceae bacterium]
MAGTQRVDAREVQAAFASGATGGTLLERAAFRVNASRRDGAGEPEVHLRDTDIFYVLEGRATVVTGGELVEPRVTGPGEIRGTDLRGGSEQRLGPGDVLTIPHGVPHWFRSVKPPFRYYVVKSVTGG